MSQLDEKQLSQLIEAALFIADTPLTINQLKQTVLETYGIGSVQIRSVLLQLELDYRERGIVLVKSGGAYQFQSREDLSQPLSALWPQKAPKFSRALLETLALIAYRQPITRGEIEQVRGVAIGAAIIRTLTERGWVTVVGHKELPGRPALYATTEQFLQYFCLQSLADLPALDDEQALAAMFNRAPADSDPHVH
ncbi:SMC-Scp complex subunit ScpB [Ferrimonas lipolytica]|uniref:SMC-Scp complex subunit ScpB n=1 Tax=Ferrimonas lipolytica TaxID=2724191 RepID=A0A6H1UCE1_9GAMM|nr:SMC-Scp complex subunit ScpB [Ferrimonas lipolytica]QIZ75876.1 SMC-Scp complex subunit ScpB [Ferrimonas lipolytica]